MSKREANHLHEDSVLETRFRREIEGEVLSDAFSRGRYATDASIYQIEPAGVILPKTIADIEAAIAIAAEEGLSIVPRGGGSSQNGQSIGPGIVIDTTKYLDAVLDFSSEARRVTVRPGIVLDRLNDFLKPYGLHFAVDPSTSSRAAIGGMAGNNSSGGRSIRYGLMADNVIAIDAILASGEKVHFANLPEDLNAPNVAPAFRNLMTPLYEMGREEADEIDARFPKVQRRVGGYNIDTLIPGEAIQRKNAAARLLVGSEGTLAFSTALTLKLHPLPKHKVLGVCHFPTFRAAMEAAQHIVKLDPMGVELIDAVMIDLARDIPLFRATIEEFVNGSPAAVLAVEFAGEDADDQKRSLKRLEELMADLGYPNSVVEALD
ncbi:MAG: FAD-binding oxidoreductase, partial [Rhodospirillales bacterium]|nr:FAD-binding oxidoreductase [Rhodospirillales bacterium]